VSEDPFSLIPGILEPQAQRRLTFDSFEEPLSEHDTVQQHFLGLLRQRADSGQGRDLISNMPESPPEHIFDMPFLGFDFRSPPETPEVMTVIEPVIGASDTGKRVPVFCPEDDFEQDEARVEEKSLASDVISTAENSQAPISFGVLVTRPVPSHSNNDEESLRCEQISVKAFEAAFARKMERALSSYLIRKDEDQLRALSEKESLRSVTPTVVKNMFPVEELDDMFYLEGKYNLDFEDFDPPFWIPEGIHDMEEFKPLTTELQWKRTVSQPPVARVEPCPAPCIAPVPMAQPEPVKPPEDFEFCAEETQSKSSRTSSKTRGSYNMLALTERMKIVNHSISHGIEDTCKKFNLSRSRIKRYIKNGVVRKTGGGRKTLDPRMEELLLNWIEDQTRDTGIFPPKCQIKGKAVELTTVSHFRGSKGWCDKFLKRNQPRLDVMKEMYLR